MSRNILNQNAEVNVYLNRDAIEATLPVQALQPTEQNPITISLKGLSGFTGQAGKVIKVNQNENALEYADDEDTTQWILSSGLLYPNLTTTDVAIGGTTNTDNRKFKVHGDAEITTQLYLTGTSSTIELNNNSSSGLYFNNNTGQGFKLFADNGFSGSPHLNNMTSSGWLFKISSTGTQKHRFLNGITEIYSDGASTDTTRNYFVKASDTNIGNYIQNDFTNNTFQLRTFTSTTDEYFLQYDTANEVLTIPDKLVLSATTNQLSDGTNNYILPSSSGTLALITDVPTTNWTVSGSNIYPTTATQVLVNTTSNSNNYGILVLDKEIAIKTSSGAGSSQGLRIINDTFSVVNYVDNTGDMYWAGATNDYNFDNDIVISNGILNVNEVKIQSGTDLQLNNGTDYTTKSTLIYGKRILLQTFDTNSGQSFTSGIDIRVGNTNILRANGSGGNDGSAVNQGYNIIGNRGALTGTEWDGYNIKTTHGGTGLESYTTGDIIYSSASNTLSKLSIGTTGQVLKVSSGGIVEWGDETQYWSLSSGVLSPLTSTNAIRCEASLAFRVGSATNYTALDYNTSNNIFSLYNTTSNTNFLEFDGDTKDTIFNCNNFTISSGTADNDCILLIQADTDNNEETANPEIRLRADGGATGVNMKLDDNDFKIETIYSGQDIVISPYSNANCVIDVGDASFKHYGEYASFNTASLNGSADMIGFTTFLSSTYASSRYPVLATNGAYLYLSLNNTIGSRTGGTYAGYVSSSGFVDVSDKKFKENITTIIDPFTIINGLRGVHFYWNELSGKPMNVRQTGFIANEVQETLPDVCDYNDHTESWGIRMGNITAVLVEGMKQQQEEINTLKHELNTLKEILARNNIV